MGAKRYEDLDLLCDLPISPIEKCVLIDIWRSTDGNHEGARQSMETIARRLGRNVRTVERAVSNLRQLWHLIVETAPAHPGGHGKPGRPATYRVHMGAVATLQTAKHTTPMSLDIGYQPTWVTPVSRNRATAASSVNGNQPTPMSQERGSGDTPDAIRRQNLHDQATVVSQSGDTHVTRSVPGISTRDQARDQGDHRRADHHQQPGEHAPPLTADGAVDDDGPLDPGNDEEKDGMTPNDVTEAWETYYPDGPVLEDRLVRSVIALHPTPDNLFEAIAITAGRAKSNPTKYLVETLPSVIANPPTAREGWRTVRDGAEPDDVERRMLARAAKLGYVLEEFPDAREKADEPAAATG